MTLSQAILIALSILAFSTYSASCVYALKTSLNIVNEVERRMKSKGYRQISKPLWMRIISFIPSNFISFIPIYNVYFAKSSLQMKEEVITKIVEMWETKISHSKSVTSQRKIHTESQIESFESEPISIIMCDEEGNVIDKQFDEMTLEERIEYLQRIRDDLSAVSVQVEDDQPNNEPHFKQ